MAAALALLALAVGLVGVDRLRLQLAAVDRGWFGAALLAGGLAQVFSVYRWERIARIFGLRSASPPRVAPGSSTLSAMPWA